jgi:hypothetical protein
MATTSIEAHSKTYAEKLLNALGTKAMAEIPKLAEALREAWNISAGTAAPPMQSISPTISFMVPVLAVAWDSRSQYAPIQSDAASTCVGRAIERRKGFQCLGQYCSLHPL